MAAGKRCKAYRNTGTDATPVWVEMGEIRDLDITRAPDQTDDSQRGSNYKKYDDGLIELEVSGELNYRNGNANCDYIRDALNAGTVFQIAAMDGAITVSGQTGPRYFCKVFQANKSEPLTDGQRVGILFKPAYHEESSVVIEPTEYTVP